MSLARLVIESEKLTQAVDEFAMQLKVCAKAWETQRTFRMNAESDNLLISFHTRVILRNCRLSVQTFSLRKNR